MDTGRRDSVSSVGSDSGISAGRRMSGGEMIEKFVLSNARNFHSNLDGFERADYVKPKAEPVKLTMKEMLKRQKVLND